MTHPDERDARPSMRLHPSVWLAAAIPVVLLLAAGYARRWAGDDGFINFRIVRQLMAGHGFVFNAGERCEAATSPGWVLVLWLAGGLGFNVERAAWVLSLALCAVGVVLAALAAGRLATDDARTRFAPFGLLAYASIPPAWDYATSALENGLGIAFLGCAYWLTSRAVLTSNNRAARWTAAFLGLAPLVRPDYAIYGALLTLLLLGVARGAKQRALVALCAALPASAYEVFRMGYYASLVPNTALAKEAFNARWAQGWLFFVNSFATYILIIPLLCVAFHLVTRARESGRWLVPATMVLAGALHIVYVVRVGGDFMHGRMLLPGLFAIFAAAGVIPLPASPARIRALVPALVLAAWAIVCATRLRVTMFEHDVLDERRWYIDMSGSPHPTELANYEHHYFYGAARDAKARIAAGCARGLAALADDSHDECKRVIIPDYMDGMLSDHPEGAILPLDPSAAADDVVGVMGYRPLGLSSAAVGLRINVMDTYGIADPVASRSELPRRGRAGHEKVFSTPWFAAKFAAENATTDERVHAAKHALRCGWLRSLYLATHEPMGWRRFWQNIGLAFKLHRIRVPADPDEAVRRFCKS
jgi:arabinofuranosyltransferase